MPTILLADDHAVVRAGLRNALDGVDGMTILAEVGDGNALRAALADHTPDLLVMDVAMPDFEPITAIQAMKRDRPGLRILIVSAYADEIDPAGLLNAGADGYHMKDQPLADLVLAAQRVLKGERWISRPLVDQLLHRPSASAVADGQPALRETPALTRRQRELLRLITYEYDNRAIAQTMLVLSRRADESIVITPADGTDTRMTLAELFAQGPIQITLLGGTGKRIKMGIEAPTPLAIRRKDE